jgi:Lipase (class 3)
MDLKTVIQFARLVNAAYAVLPTNLANATGTTLSVGGTNYTVVTTIYCNDLGTDINPLRGNNIVSIGLVLQDAGTGDVVLAVRGTEGIMEWVQDARFCLVSCPFAAGSGNTEDGFTAMYNSFRIGSDAKASAPLCSALATLKFPKPVTATTSVTVCGHSLGGALATLLALDVAVNTIFKNPTVYTYASPRAGDSAFTAFYNHMVPNTTRVANRMDLVPKLPMPPLYDHVSTPSELNPVQMLPLPPKVLVKPTLACEHILDTYLYLLSLAAGGEVIPLDAACAA